MKINSSKSLSNQTFLVVSIFIALFFGACNQGSNAWSADHYRRAATALHEKGLYSETADIYKQYLHSSVISGNDIPKVLFALGNLYLEKLSDPAQALANYTMIATFAPDETFGGELGPKIVACLEQLGRSTEAKSTLQSLTSLNEPTSTSAKTNNGTQVVAELGDRKITLGEIEEAIGGLPKGTLEQNQIVQQYIAQIVLAESAERKGLNKKPAIQNKIQFVRTQILAQANLSSEIQIPQPSENDLKTFFQAYQSKYASESLATFEAAKEKVLQDWARQKQGEAYQAYIQKLLSSDRVRFYPIQGS